LYVADTGNNRVQKLQMSQIAATLTPVVAGSTPAPTISAVPSASPTATTVSLSPFETLWANSLHAEAALSSVHSTGKISKQRARVEFVGDCGAYVLHIRLSGKDKKGRAATVEYLAVGSRIWERFGRGHGHWGAWSEGSGSDVEVFIPFEAVICPQADVAEFRAFPISDVSLVFRDLGSAVVAGKLTRHIREVAKGGSLDLYIDVHTFLWLRYVNFDKATSITYDVVYSRFNGRLPGPPKP